MSDVNPLCLDLAGLTRTERQLLRLHDRYHLRVADLAEAFETCSEDVARTLRRARAKYRNCYERLDFDRARKKIKPPMSSLKARRP